MLFYCILSLSISIIAYGLSTFLMLKALRTQMFEYMEMSDKLDCVSFVFLVVGAVCALVVFLE